MSKNAAFYKKRWFQYGAISMLLIGFGISLVGEAILKASGVQVMEWIALGTFGLIALNALSCTFGKSIACKVRERIPRF
jgi:hypothetical protein